MKLVSKDALCDNDFQHKSKIRCEAFNWCKIDKNSFVVLSVFMRVNKKYFEVSILSRKIFFRIFDEEIFMLISITKTSAKTKIIS